MMVASEDRVPSRCPDSGSLTFTAIRPQIRPTPAAAPSLNHNDRSDRQLCGRLKLVLDQSSTTYYVAPPRPVCDLVRNTNQALRVRCNSFSGATLLEPLVSFNQAMVLDVRECAHLFNAESFVPFLAGRSVGDIQPQHRKGVY